MEERLLKEFSRLKKVRASTLARKFGMTRQGIHRHLKRLIASGQILKIGTSRKTTFYVLNRPKTIRAVFGKVLAYRRRFRREDLDEERVFQEINNFPRLLEGLKENVRILFHYAFTEILNNAIDHSESKWVDVGVESNPHQLRFRITDHGIGIFENIRRKKGLNRDLEAIQDLLKGKQTTAPDYHSGEGIFFTSKVADRFVIESHRKCLMIDNRIHDVFVRDIRFRKGTQVHFELVRGATRQLEDIFRQFTGEEFHFDKSRVNVKLYREGEEYISRSQAKRLLHALESFCHIVLDFKDVPVIGQGFADEIFRVFATQHPDIKIHPINCHENARLMIDRAISTADPA